MDTGNKHSPSHVDDILEELKGKGKPAAAGGNLDDILAELGMAGGASPTARPTAPPAPKTTVASPAAQGAGNREPAPKRAPAKAAAQKETPAPKKEAPSTPQEDLFSRPAKRSSVGDTTIMDIQVEHTTGISRVGKAAALDKVEAGKYTEDTELLSWFGGEETQQLSPREARRMEKERKKQEAADRKAGKRSRPVREQPDELPPLPDSLDIGRTEQEAAGARYTPEEPDAPTPNPAPRREAAVHTRQTEDTPLVSWDEPEDTTPATRVRRGEEPAGPGLFEERTPPAVKAEAPASAPATTRAKPTAANRSTAPIKAAADGLAAGTAANATAAPAVASAVAAGVASKATQPPPAKAQPGGTKIQDTQTYDVDAATGERRIPTAAYTQEFSTVATAEQPTEATAPAVDPRLPPAAEGDTLGEKSLFLDDMVDDRFRAFFGETVIVDQEEIEEGRRKRKKARTRTSLFTGEFAQLEKQLEGQEQAEAEGELDEDEYNRPQDAHGVEGQLQALRRTLTIKLAATGVVALLLFWLGLGYAAILPLPAFMAPAVKPIGFGIAYLLLILVAIGINFTTVAAGLVGLVGEPTVDSAPALAGVAALLQAVVVLIGLVTGPAAEVTLFGCLAALVFCFSTLGKRIRAGSILANFALASAGMDHSAGYVVDGQRHEIAFNITDGLEEDDPVLLVSRPTALVKGFMRQSFSLRWSDGIGRITGWVLLGASLAAGIISFAMGGDMLQAVSAFAAALCVGAPFSSTLVSAIPSLVMQHNTSKVGAVVPGWSAVQELGDVNVVMAGARDIFPPSSVELRGIKTFQKERIDVAILYAASVLIEGCDTMRDIFLGVIQGKSDMLYKVESLTTEPGRGFTAWVENHRIVIGTREMLQRHDIDPPSVESELKYLKAGCVPVYLAVSGKLFAMFVVKYTADEEVAETLEGLVKSGVSLMVTSNDMNVTGELVQAIYGLPAGVVKVLGKRELDLLEPMTSYIPESEGVMTHIGTFTSFIGGMSAAAGCAASERMSVIVQLASVIVAVLLSLVLVISGGLASLSFTIALLFQIGWTVLVCALPFARRF